MPALALEPCTIVGLPANATQADLDMAYIARGAEIISCDAKRELAAATHQAEHDDEEAWLKAITPAPSFWRRALGLGR